MENYNLGIAGKHSHPIHFRIKNFFLYPHNIEFSAENPELDEKQDAPGKEESKKAANILDIVDTFSFSESLTQATLFGEVNIVDSINILENYKISGGEKVEIEILQDLKSELKEIKLEFYIAAIQAYSKPSIGSQSYKLSLATKEHYLNSLTKINNEFDDVPTKIITDIVDQLGQEVNVEGGGSASMKGIFPKLRPFDAINWILRNSHDTQTPMFFYQDHKDGYQLKSYKSILDKMQSVGAQVKEKITGDSSSGVYSEYSNNPYGLELTNQDPDYYEINRKKILSFTIDNFSNKISQSRKGAYNSRLRYVDIAKKYYSPAVDFTYEDKNLLNEYKPFSTIEGEGINDYVNDDYKHSREYFINVNTSLYGSSSSYHSSSPENIQKTISSYQNLLEMRANIAIAGDPNMVPGLIIDLKLFKNQPEDLKTNDAFPDNAFFGGKYLVESITHSFSNDGYYMNVGILKDSYKIDLDEKVKL